MDPNPSSDLETFSKKINVEPGLDELAAEQAHPGEPLRRSWRDDLSIHPAAELFPRMSPDELKALGEDILKKNLTSPIVLWRSDPKAPAQLIDGISRLDALELVAGGPVIVGAPSVMAGKNFLALDKVIVLDKSVDPYAFVVSANVHRRHLSVEQKRELIAKLLEVQPEKSDRHIAKTVKADHKTVGTVRSEMEGRGEIPHVETRTDTKGRRQPARKKSGTKKPARVGERHHGGGGGLADRGQHRDAGAAGDDIGPDSAGELRRLESQVDELQNRLRCQTIQIAGLESQIEELRTAAAEAFPEAPGTALELVNALEYCLRHNGVNAPTLSHLAKVRTWVERSGPLIELSAAPVVANSTDTKAVPASARL
jgi:hypothetical protein